MNLATAWENSGGSKAHGEPVGRRDAFPVEGPEQLDLVVPRQTECRTVGHHAHGQAQNSRRGRSPVDQVAQEEHPPALRVTSRRGLRRDVVTEQGQQLDELGVATVDVTDDVERTGVGSSVVPQRLSFEAGRLDLLFTGEDEYPVEALSTETPDGTAELRLLVAQDVRPELPILARSVAVSAHPLGDVEDDGHGEDMVFLGQGDETPSGLYLDVGGVDHGEAAGIEPLPGDEPQHVEGGVGCGLVVLVVTDESSTEVGGQHLGRQEMATRKGRLARSGHADQRDEGKLRDLDDHREKTAICVGHPTSASTSPMPEIFTS
jgi:hypothetical protein